MADGKRGVGPGAYVDNGVVCTQGSPFSKAKSSKEGQAGGEFDRNKAPFGHPHDTGNGGIPTKFFDGMSSKSARTIDTSSAGASPIVGISKRNPSERRFKE